MMNFKTITPGEIGFRFDMQMEYDDNLFMLLSLMKPGQQIQIASLTNKASKLIEVVKELISVWGVKDVLFSNDFLFIQKHLSFDDEMKLSEQKTAQQNNKSKRRNTFYKHD